MMRYLIFVSGLCVLCGCSTPQEKSDRPHSFLEHTVTPTIDGKIVYTHKFSKLAFPVRIGQFHYKEHDVLSCGHGSVVYTNADSTIEVYLPDPMPENAKLDNEIVVRDRFGLVFIHIEMTIFFVATSNYLYR